MCLFVITMTDRSLFCSLIILRPSLVLIIQDGLIGLVNSDTLSGVGKLHVGLQRLVIFLRPVRLLIGCMIYVITMLFLSAR